MCCSASSHLRSLSRRGVLTGDWTSPISKTDCPPRLHSQDRLGRFTIGGCSGKRATRPIAVRGWTRGLAHAPGLRGRPSPRPVAVRGWTCGVILRSPPFRRGVCRCLRRGVCRRLRPFRRGALPCLPPALHEQGGFGSAVHGGHGGVDPCSC